MALIRATCSECGDVELRSCDVRVRVCEDTKQATYLFRCPVCRMTEVKGADDQVVDILVSAGCALSSWRLPKELDEHPKVGGTITYDDLIDFHDRINDDDDGWLCDLQAHITGDTG